MMIRKLFVASAFTLAFPMTVSAGPIDEAEPLAVGLVNILDFLLAIIGVVAIIGLAVAGFLYFFAAGDMRQIALAKKATLAGVTGIVVALGGYILIRTLVAFLTV